MISLAKKSYWNKGYKNLEFSIAPSNDSIRLWIEKYIPRNKTNKTCFEIGCFPGKYLAIFGELNYRLSGLDFNNSVNKELLIWLKSKKYKIGKFKKVNLFNDKIKKQYNIVCSFGFIEHFREWKKVLLKHTEYVENNGYIIITTPNFRGLLFRLLHYFLDKKNYERHNIQSMQPRMWDKLLKEKGYKIIYFGYFGKFQFWVDNEKRNNFQIKLIAKINKYSRILQKIPEGFSWFSPYCGIIAIKKNKYDIF